MFISTIFEKSCTAAICLTLTMPVTLSAHSPSTSIEQPLDREINALLNLEESWHTTLHIDNTPEQPISVRIPIGNMTYTLELEPRSTRSDGYQVVRQNDEGELYEVPAGPVRTLRGSIAELDGSIASASLMEDGLYARIRLGNGEEVWLEPIGDRIKGSQEDLYAFYFTHDVIDSGGICGTEDYESHVNVGDILRMLANYDANTAQRGTIICTAQLAFDTDYEYWQDWGSQTESRINQVVNSLNIQYEDEVSLTFEITHIIVRDTSNDPYTTTDCGGLLGQFENEWQSNQGGIIRDIAHLFTGKNLADCVGIAATPGVCQSWGYSLAQSDYGNNYSYTTQVSAHELGHGLNASHQTSPTFNTMYPSINGGNTFNSNSVAEITSYANSINCLSCENQAPIGACCLAGGQCIEIYQSNCEAGNGEWQGNNTTCAGSDCSDPVGACCIGGICSEYTELNCSDAGGSYAGDGSDCGSTGCTAGACCVDTSCSITLQADCAGSWYGDNSNCADVTCGAGADQLNYELRTWSSSDGQAMETYDLYFPSTDPNTKMISVFGENADFLHMKALSNADFDGTALPYVFHQSPFGNDLPHDRALDPVLGVDVEFDSYVTVGSDDAADGVPLVLGFDSAGFASGHVMMTNGIWFVIPDDPLASMGAGSALGHRLVSLSVESGKGVEVTVNIQWFDGAGVVHENRGIEWNNEGLGGGGTDCPTDVNGSGTTDVSDLLTMIADWGPCSGCNTDLDGNGVVNVSDLLEVIGAWGACE